MARIETLGKRNKGKLVKEFGFKSITQAKKNFDVKTDIEALAIMKYLYNQQVDNEVQTKQVEKQQLNQKRRQIKKDNKVLEKETSKQLLELPVETKTTQQSREDRIKSKMSNVITDRTSTNIEKKQNRYHRKALGNAFEDVEIRNNIKSNNIVNIINDTILHKLIHYDKTKNLNINLFIGFKMKRKGKKCDFGFNSINVERFRSPSQIKQWVEEEMVNFENRIENLAESDFVLSKFSKINVQFSQTNKIRGGSFIELPEWIKLNHSCVNIKNTDDKCIHYALVASQVYDTLTRKDKNMTIAYKNFMDVIKLPNDIQFPIDTLTDIPKIERLNDMKINVYHLDGNSVEILYNNKSRNTKVVNLLLLDNGVKNHFVWIRDLARLICKDKSKRKHYICSQCLCNTFNKQKDLDEHTKLCFQYEAVRTKYPTKDKNILTFKNYGKTFKHPFSVYMDFESTLEKVDKEDVYQKHIVNSCGYKYNCIYDEYDEPLQIINSNTPDKIIEKVIIDLERLAKKSYDITKQNMKYSLTSEEWKNHKSNTLCQDCQCEYTETNKKVIHHDHITGKYISSICNKCNLHYKYEKFLPVYIHNLKGYDAHFIIPFLNQFGAEGKVSCIPNTEEKYISFSKSVFVDRIVKEDGKTVDIYYEIRFLDTLAFLPSSLDNLTQNLKNGCNDNMEDLRKTFKNVSTHFKNDDEFKLMIQKGIYPYDYITSYDVLHEKELPSIDKFYSKLNDTSCSEESYEKAKIVWNTFQCKSFMDYHNLYLTSDVLLLADIWENFKNVCYKIYKLDVSYYYTSPGLSWDAFLKHTQEEYKTKKGIDFEIELLTDESMYLFVENNIRGGLSQISKRYAKANHQGLSSYDKTKMDEYILYLDANNLYGYAMCEYLPQNNFQWNYNHWTEEEILKLDDKGDVGYMFDVDLHYPKELHDLHNGYALAPENMKIKNSMLNDWQTENRKDATIKKLTTSFYDKTNYGLNYRLLKLYLQLGLKIIKVNRVLQFNQSNYMESYIMKNTNERKKAQNDFEKDFYKLMNNSVYGKTMENVRNRINFRLIESEEDAMRVRNILKRYTIFNEKCVGIHLMKKEVVLNKPIFIGQTVLDQSKYLMSNFHYNFMLKQFERKNIDLLFTDTDSLCYHIKNQNPYETIEQNKDLFDLSAYPKSHKLYDPTNKKVIGKFKDEAIDGEVSYITEFVGLRSKLYSYKTESKSEMEEHHRCKGVKKCVIQKEMKTDLYKQVLFSRQNFKVKQNGFRSRGHQIYTEIVEKVGLSCNDDKSYILDNNIQTLTLGHYKIINKNETS